MLDMRNKGWFYLENALVDRDDLEPLERLLYMVLARHANARGECFPSQERLLKVTGIKDKRTIKKYMDKLIEKGFIEIEMRKGKSHLYYLKNIPEKEDTPPTSNEVGVAGKVPTQNVHTSNVLPTQNVHTPPTSNVPTTPHMKCTPKETKFKETNLRNNDCQTVNQSTADFINKLLHQGLRFSSGEMSKIMNLAEECKADPMSSYRKSSYLRGEKEIKPTKRMFLLANTWEKMALGDYDDKEPKRYSKQEPAPFKQTEYSDYDNSFLDEILGGEYAKV